MRPSTLDRIENLRARRAQLDAELSRLEAKTRSENRKMDTRRKILIGAIIMQEMEDDPEVDAHVKGLLEKRLSKPRDRSLFNLPASAHSPGVN
jgi:protein subunit release factor B